MTLVVEGGMPLQFLDITRIDISVRYMVVILMKIWWLMPKKHIITYQCSFKKEKNRDRGTLQFFWQRISQRSVGEL